MKLEWSRRRVLTAAGAIAAGSMPKWVVAQTYPHKPVTVVIPSAAGGMSDPFVNLLAEQLRKQFGQTAVMDFRAGGGSVIGSKYVAGAQPDGYTLLLGNIGPLAITPALEQVSYNPSTDFTPIALIIRSPNLMVVGPKLKVGSVAEVIAEARRQPGKLSYGSSGVGSSHHLAGELFKQRTGVDIVHVPYKGGAPAVNDLMGGHVDMMFGNTALVVEQVKTGVLKPLAFTGRSRNSLFPQVPTMEEAGVADYEVTSWLGLLGPANLPAAVVVALNEAMNAALQTEGGKAVITRFAGEAGTGTPADFRQFIASEQRKWGDVIRKANLKAS
ncbi:Bug family tripartite tricarboxylate transporter substrate binding protein [Variovorax sp. VNK109]|uniref:Bug family tripartite tricarboxylate transporter substrate binding protein n=1 Tax=Variovorax sp. VNK109 TaxID=3400919 RepID=UPI003C0B1987